MSDRDRSAERRGSRARPSKDTGARARSRSPARRAGGGRDRDHDSSGTANTNSNPYSRRGGETSGSNLYNTRREGGRDESSSNPYSSRRDDRNNDRSASNDNSRRSDARPPISSAFSDDRRRPQESSRRDSAGAPARDRNTTRSGTNDTPVGPRGGHTGAVNTPSALAGDRNQGGSGGRGGNQGGRQQGGGSWGSGFGGGRDDRGGGDNRGGNDRGGGDNRGGRDNYGGGRRDGGGGGRDNFRGNRGGGSGGFNDRQGGNRGPIVSGPPLPEYVSIPENGKETQLPTPQMQGRAGVRTTVFANHFEIQSLPRIELYMYDIRVTGDKTGFGPLDESEVKQCSPAMVNKVMENPEIKEMLGVGFIFDGVSVGWSTKKLGFPVDPFRYRLELSGSRPGRTFCCNIDISLVGKFNTDPFMQWLRNDQGRITLLGGAVNATQEDHVQLCLKFLNALLRSNPAKRFITGQGNKSTTYFDRTPSTTLALRSTGGVLEAWRGFYQTVVVRFGKLTVNVDTTTNAFIQPGINFLAAIAGFAGMSPDRVEDAFLHDRDTLTPIMRKLVGVGFKTKHMKEGPKRDMVKRVMRMTARGAGEEQFERRKFTKNPATGEDDMTLETITVAEYYYQQYDINVRYPRLPLVESRKGEKYPMELCFVADSERWKDTLQGAETADFIKFATGPAFLRKAQIGENLKKLAWHNQGELKEFGVSIKPQFMELEARVLPPPIPLYSQGTDSYPPQGGRWNLKQKTFHTAQKITGWGLIYFPGGRSQQVSEERLRDFAGLCNRAFSSYGMQVERQDPPTCTANPQGDIKRTILEMLQKVRNIKGIRPNLIIFLLSSISPEPYATIKHICDTEFGVASQCMIVEKALTGAQLQYLGNISLKVNIKLGGINSWINDPVLSRRPTMVMGCDAAHPNPSQRRMNPPPPTFTALAANYDSFCAKYTAVTSSQEPGQEIVNNFGPMAEELVRRFSRQTSREPETILYFRDGVSEGELSSVLSQELEQLKRVTKAKITVIVCVKRHHTRIFPVLPTRDKNGNVVPGTVIENGSGKDIFLIAHVALQGTVRPTHYIVLYDENNLSVDEFQGLCNNLCYGYGRATVAVSMVPPVYYAHLACERSRQHVRHANDGTSTLQQVQESLKYSMWWQ